MCRFKHYCSIQQGTQIVFHSRIKSYDISGVLTEQQTIHCRVKLIVTNVSDHT
jgi:hypothetical protein